MPAWKEYCKSGNKPRDIPSHPDYVYKNEGWKGVKNWLGTENKKPASRHDKYRPFVDAREFAHKIGIKSQNEWHHSYCKSSKKPSDIPSSPAHQYKNEWIGMWDWLGYEEGYWSISKVKELLKDLIESRIIYQWNEGVFIFGYIISNLI